MFVYAVSVKELFICLNSNFVFDFFSYYYLLKNYEIGSSAFIWLKLPFLSCFQLELLWKIALKFKSLIIPVNKRQ